ncbi:hypothetical protein [Nostoc sp. CALU 546]|uniref:hypothetical protein n=1 Tax=Nostoc sp. CALU 546 TaxID=1867241 RepID=UPI003B67AC4A
MSKDLKNKVDSIRRTLKNNSLEVSATVIESKILELYPNHQTEWNSDVRAEVIKSVTNNYKLSQTVSAITPIVNEPPVQELTKLQESETFTEEELEDKEIEDDDEDEVNVIAPLELTEVSHSLAVTNADKQALVSTQSLALGFELSEQECLLVADNLDDVFNDYASFLTSVTTAIKGYVDHRFNEAESTLDTNADVVRSHIADRAARLNQKVENFSTNVKADIGGIRQNIKSSKANILSRFALPSKTG